MHEIADREDALSTCSKRLVDHRAVDRRVHRQATRRAIVIGDPVAGEHDRVALDRAAVGQDDGSTRCRPMISATSTPVRIGTRCRVAVANLSTAYVWWRVSGRHHRRHLAADVPQGEDRREADVLGTDDHRPPADA